MDPPLFSADGAQQAVPDSPSTCSCNGENPAPRGSLAGFLVLILSLFLACPTAAEAFKDGQAAYAQGDYTTALGLWQPLAEQGDVKARYQIGLMHFIGQGVARDYAQAAKWFRLAAAQGHADAQHMMANMFYAGQGVPQDYAEAARWLRLAAEQGDTTAQLQLGGMYRSGRGVPQDYAAAARWFRSAAERGHAFAQMTLGRVYEKGEGVPQDYVQSYKWYSLAGAPNPSASSPHQNLAAEFRDRVAGKMTPAQIPQAQELAQKWKPTD